MTVRGMNTHNLNYISELTLAWLSWVWLCALIILTLGRLRISQKGGHEMEASLGYIGRPHFNNSNKQQQQQITSISDVCLYLLNFISINYFLSLKFCVIAWFCFSSKWTYFVSFCTWYPNLMQSSTSMYMLHSFISFYCNFLKFFGNFLLVSNTF